MPGQDRLVDKLLTLVVAEIGFALNEPVINAPLVGDTGPKSRFVKLAITHPGPSDEASELFKGVGRRLVIAPGLGQGKPGHVHQNQDAQGSLRRTLFLADDWKVPKP